MSPQHLCTSCYHGSLERCPSASLAPARCECHETTLSGIQRTLAYIDNNQRLAMVGSAGVSVAALVCLSLALLLV